MKKIYSKPGIVFEDFSLNTHITKTCDVELGTFEQGTCGGYSYGSIPGLFMEGMKFCETKTVDDGSNPVCYHVPIEGAKLFNS